MIRHYLKIALRNMSRQKMYSVINVGGFAIGIAACLLFALYINNETNYDQDNPNKNHVYRIIGEVKRDGIMHSGISFSALMAKALFNDFPEVEKAGKPLSSELFGGANNQVRRTDQQSNNMNQDFVLPIHQ